MTQWEDIIYSYFDSRENSRGVPLSYVIRKDTSSPKYSEIRYVQIIYQSILVGNIFTRDSRKVLDIFKELTLVTDSETWIKGLKPGRNAMQELQDHYDGKSEESRRKQVSRADLKNIFYKNETTFTFKKYFTKLKGIFNVLKNMMSHSRMRRWSSIY